MRTLSEDVAHRSRPLSRPSECSLCERSIVERIAGPILVCPWSTDALYREILLPSADEIIKENLSREIDVKAMRTPLFIFPVEKKE